MNSCIFEGRVRHSRKAPVDHSFAYRIFFMYLDLDELPALFRHRWFWSSTRPALARFRRSDHLGPSGETLDQSVRALVERETGVAPRGPIRLLTHLSYFGYCFNPVSFYYCYDESGSQLETIVAEVNNTPWGEQTCYVLADSDNLGKGSTRRFSPPKLMHVSPFLEMEIDYDWSFTEPADSLKVFMANSRDGTRVLDVALSLQRTEISAASLARVLVMYPFMTMSVMKSIYWQALKLWIKACPFYPHPSKRAPISAQQPAKKVEL